MNELTSEYIGHSREIDPVGAADRNVEARIRCATFFRLAEGHFHQLRNDLAKIVAEHELHLSQSNTGSNAMVDPTECSKEVIRLTTRLSGSINSLDDLHHVFASGDSPATAQECCDMIGTMIGGALQWTRDSRSSEVAVVSGPHVGGDFPIENDLVTSLMFPVLIKVLDEVVASGDITVRSLKSAGNSTIRFQIEKSIIGHVDIDTILGAFDGQLYFIDGNRMMSLANKTVCLGHFGSADAQGHYIEFYTNIWTQENISQKR